LYYPPFSSLLFLLLTPSSLILLPLPHSSLLIPPPPLLYLWKVIPPVFDHECQVKEDLVHYITTTIPDTIDRETGQVIQGRARVRVTARVRARVRVMGGGKKVWEMNGREP